MLEMVKGWWKLLKMAQDETKTFDAGGSGHKVKDPFMTDSMIKGSIKFLDERLDALALEASR